MATSYISEHSAEYYLVPALKRILDSEFEFVAPVFPWLSREFSKVSRSIHLDDKFHVLVMFPRRPKITENNEQVFVTINVELEDFNSVGNEYGVPIIAGCPNASSLWELASCRDFVWINIAAASLCPYLIPIGSSNHRSAWLTEKSIINMVKKSTVFNLSSFEIFLRDARESQPETMYGGQYRPVYFLIKAQ